MPPRLKVALRLTLLGPPAGVQFCLEDNKHQLSSHVIASGKDLSFDLEIEAQLVDGIPRFFGRFALGPPTKRFIYVCSGTCAGQSDTCWTRRAKVPLAGICWPLVEAASYGRLEARFHGIAGDGGPVCASVKLLDDSWRVSAI